MPTERLSMRHIREVLRLHYSVGMSQRAVARSLGLAQGTVSKYLNRTRRAGLTWPLPPELDDDVRLENRLYPPPSDRRSDERPHVKKRPRLTPPPLGRSIAWLADRRRDPAPIYRSNGVRPFRPALRRHRKLFLGFSKVRTLERCW